MQVLIFLLIAIPVAMIGACIYLVASEMNLKWPRLSIGTRSVLYGAHCFLIHPFYVAKAWHRLYGFPWDPRLWFAFFLHDLGYIGKPNMDGEEGELHPYWGAFVMGFLFGRRWYEFTLYHSRFLAKKNGAHFSRLCVADKYAFALTPAWLYLPMVNWTGEIKEYMKLADKNNTAEFAKYAGMQEYRATQREWRDEVAKYMTRWVEEHKDLKPDTWTPEQRKAVSATGVY